MGGAALSIGASSVGPLPAALGDGLKSGGRSGTAAGLGVGSGGVVVAVSGFVPSAPEAADGSSGAPLAEPLPAAPAAAGPGAGAGLGAAPPEPSRRLISDGEDGSPGEAPGSPLPA